MSQELFGQLYEECYTREKRLTYATEKLEAISAAHPVCQRLETISGMEPLTVTALVAAVNATSALKKTAVALANKNARIAWVRLTTDHVYIRAAVA